MRNEEEEKIVNSTEEEMRPLTGEDKTSAEGWTTCTPQWAVGEIVEWKSDLRRNGHQRSVNKISRTGAATEGGLWNIISDRPGPSLEDKMLTDEENTEVKHQKWTGEN